MFQIFKKIRLSLIAFGERLMAGVQAFIHAIMASSLVQKATMFAVAMCMSLSNVWATSTGAGGFTKATTEISSYQTPVANLMKAIAAVIVLVGAFNVYFKMQNGDQDVKKTIMLFANKCKFLNAEIFENILYIIEIQYFQRFLNKTEFHGNLKVFQSA